MTISATIIKDSISPEGIRITTFELEYPRFVHSEFMTHREFSRNAASSRAIPIPKMIQQVKDSPAEPVHWGKNQAGMQAKEELSGQTKIAARYSWLEAAKEMVSRAEIMHQIGAHKQIVNRLLEPFQTIKVVMTTTGLKNFFWLRDHEDADPTIRRLAGVMKGVFDYSKPELLDDGMWHLPYVTTRIENGVQTYWADATTEISLEQAQQISCSCCAQVSYRKLDTSLEKAIDIYQKLIGSEPVHASAFEHVATPIVGSWENGVTHYDGTDYWSGNFRGWIQYRQLIPNNAQRG